MTTLTTRVSTLLAAWGFLLAVDVTTGSAQVLYYDRTANPGWLTSNAWNTVSGGSGNTNWVDGSSATFGAGGALSVSITNPETVSSSSVSVAGMTNTGSRVTIAKSLGGSAADVISFTDGATINGDFTFGSRITVTGNFEVQSGSVQMSGANNSAINGTATVSGGTLDFGQPVNLGTTTNLIVNGGLLRVGFANSSSSAGAVTVNNGTFEFGRATNTTTGLTISSLSGTGGTLRSRAPGTGVSGAANSLTVNQNVDTTYSGAIIGTGDGGISPSTLSLTKSGTGNLTLSGTISGMQKTTTVNDGRLYINGNTTSFGDNTGSTAISVASGGTLGGTGTITTLAGDSVIVANGGSLTAGLADSAGKTTYALGTGASLDLSAATGDTGWLKFELGSLATPGTTYDQIIISSGTLAIGSGLLNFADFDFTALSGFGEGEYLLFSSSDLSGTLASSNLSGTISGHDATLGLLGNNIILTVAVPEPSAVSLLVGLGMWVFVFRFARKRRRLS